MKRQRGKEKGGFGELEIGGAKMGLEISIELVFSLDFSDFEFTGGGCFSWFFMVCFFSQPKWKKQLKSVDLKEGGKERKI